jgi:hypothetical protein
MAFRHPLSKRTGLVPKPIGQTVLGVMSSLGQSPKKLADNHPVAGIDAITS